VTRVEFSAKIKVAAFERAGGQCEECNARLIPGQTHYDHIIPCGLGGSAGLDNCQVLCKSCHGAKTTKKDVPQISKAKRVQKKHVGATKAKRKMPYRKFNGDIVWPRLK